MFLSPNTAYLNERAPWADMRVITGQEFLEDDTSLWELISVAKDELGSRFTFTENPSLFAHCLSWKAHTWHLQSLFAPRKGSLFMLRIFQEARVRGIKNISLLARTNDESLHTQEYLESWYNSFWFETTSRTVNGTNMSAAVESNRPLNFRIDEYKSRVNGLYETLPLNPPSTSLPAPLPTSRESLESPVWVQIPELRGGQKARRAQESA